MANDRGSRIIKVGEGNELRKVEKDVLIPKIMKEKAMGRCSEYVQAFEDCVRGRLLSVAWACREQNKKMQDCLNTLYHDVDFYKECEDEYLAQREEYRRTGVKKKKEK